MKHDLSLRGEIFNDAVDLFDLAEGEKDGARSC